MRRAVSITVVASSLWIAAVVAVVVGAALLFPGTVLDRMWAFNRPAHAAFQAMGRAVAIGFLVLGTVAGGAAQGLLRGRRWAWWVALGIFGVNGMGDVVGFIRTRDWIRSGLGMVVAGAFVGVLVVGRRVGGDRR